VRILPNHQNVNLWIFAFLANLLGSGDRVLRSRLQRNVIMFSKD
jgi:hypothetical protein